MTKIACPIKTAAQSSSGAQPAILNQTHKISYRIYDQLIDAAVKKLQASGIKRGDVAAIHSPNNLAYVVLLPALWRIGAVSGHLNTRAPIPSLIKQIKKIGSNFLLTQDGKFPKAIPGVKKIRLEDIIWLTSIGDTRFRAFSGNQKATILFTSGSSGDPKAVTHTYANHYYNAKGSNENIAVKSGDRWLLSLPLYHVSGLGIIFRCAVGRGTVVIPKNNDDIVSAIKEYGVTHISLVTTQLYRLLQDPKNIPVLRKLKTILLGGGPIAPNLLAAAKKYHLPVYLSYGLTEAASQVATSPQPRTGAKVLKYRQIRISKDGEIWVKGKTLCCGIKKWFATGDLGQMDEKENLSVLGRKDNMFISGGENIYPEEIERELLSLPCVIQAIVVPRSDPEFGQRPVAFIKGNISLSEIISDLQRTLPRFKIPQAIYPWPADLPQGLKIRRQHFLNLVTKKKS